MERLQRDSKEEERFNSGAIGYEVALLACCLLLTVASFLISWLAVEDRSRR